MFTISVLYKNNRILTVIDSRWTVGVINNQQLWLRTRRKYWTRHADPVFSLSHNTNTSWLYYAQPRGKIEQTDVNHDSASATFHTRHWSLHKQYHPLGMQLTRHILVTWGFSFLHYTYNTQWWFWFDTD